MDFPGRKDIVVKPDCHGFVPHHGSILIIFEQTYGQVLPEQGVLHRVYKEDALSLLGFHALGLDGAHVLQHQAVHHGIDSVGIPALGEEAAGEENGEQRDEEQAFHRTEGSFTPSGMNREVSPL